MSTDPKVWNRRNLWGKAKHPTLVIEGGNVRALCKPLNVLGLLNATEWRIFTLSNIKEIRVVAPFSLSLGMALESSAMAMYHHLIITDDRGDRYYIRLWHRVARHEEFIAAMHDLGVNVVVE